MLSQKIALVINTSAGVLESSLQNSIPHAFTGMELAQKEQDPNLGGALNRQIMTKVRGVFPSIPGIQKYHLRESEEVPR